MDIAVFALAAQARRLDEGQAITAPRRIFFVVDRRIIVDEAYERARRLADKLAQATGGILKTVKDNLRHIGQGVSDWTEGEPPLAVHALRGGMYRSEAWARNPLQPTIVASTVDQVGSRLLFRAYGRGFGTWPIYAGLIANDSLVLLDEAHCSQPFQQTLHAVRKYVAWAGAPLERCFHPVVMSATPPPVQDVFDDPSDEGTDPEHPLGRRQLARKPAKLREVTKAKGKRATAELSKELAATARRLIADGLLAVVVFANRVATAREAHRLLRDSGVDTVLLTGRMRPADKDAVVERLGHLGLHSDQSKDRCLDEPVVVVATQTLEVGADLDFDGLATECASLDALRQRFGRLNRMGRGVNARADILIRGDQVKPKESDPVYGNALAETWAWLLRIESENGEVDFGIAALNQVLPLGEALIKLNAPALDAPVLLPAHVDSWCQTAPTPQPSPDVGLFLHGPQQGRPDVQVCWRADLDLSGDETQGEALSALALCPPSSVETLPVPIGVFKHWLAAATDFEDDSADVEGSGTQEAACTPGLDGGSEDALRRVVRWRGRETGRDAITADPSDIRPGDVIVIPAGHPGPWQQLGDFLLNPADPAGALDIGDRAHRLARAKPILRLHPDLIDVWPDSLAAKASAKSLLDDELERKYEEDPDEIVDAVDELLVELAASPVPDHWSWLPLAARELRTEYSTVRKLRRGCRLTSARSLVVAGRRRVPSITREFDAFSDEDDAAASGISHPNGTPVRLRIHLPGVECFARRHAVGCGLPEPLVDAVARAGLLHDLGKADPRFQSLLRGGSRWDGRDPWAKSADMPQTNVARQRARKASGYPEGGRHELLSVRMAEAVPELLPADTDLRDLVLHLVASHHGHCRPFAPVVLDDEQVGAEFELNGHRTRWRGPTNLERLDSGVADRFWQLTRRYGWWGLAWLETLLRLADWRRSEWEETHDDE